MLLDVAVRMLVGGGTFVVGDNFCHIQWDLVEAYSCFGYIVYPFSGDVLFLLRDRTIVSWHHSFESVVVVPRSEVVVYI